MKKLTKYFLLLSAIAFSLTACKEKEADYEAGPADPDNCYGVYFPSQEASGSHTYDPEMDRVVSITVSRTNTQGAISVPYTTEVSADGVFNFGAIEFADGQSETTLDVTFPSAKVGTPYSFSIILDDDNAYIPHYNKGAIAFDFDVLIVTWEYILNPETKEKALFTFNQVFWGETAYGYVKYYEVDGVRTCITETLPEHVYGDPYEGGGFFGQLEVGSTEGELEFKMYTENFNADGNMFVEIIPSFIYHHSSYDADVYLLDYYHYWTDYADANGNHQAALEGLSFIDFANKYSATYPLSYYDGNGGLYFYVRTYGMYGIGGWTVDDIGVIGIAEGFTRVDYSLEIEQAGVCYDNAAPVEFKLGPDVTKVAFKVLEGDLSNIQTANALEEFVSKEALTTENYVEASGVYDIAIEGATGTYTMLAAAIAPDVKTGKETVQQTATLKILFMNEEDAAEYEVEFNGGLNTAEKYIPQGIVPETSLEFFIYGTDLVQVKYGAFTFLDLYKDYDACVDALLEKDDVPADVLEAINGEGYVGVLKNLLPGTEYYLLVYANNGYEEAVDYFGPCTTPGDPLPIYQSFDQSSIDEDLFPETSEGFYGTYNFYNVNFFDNETGLREYSSKVTIAESAYEGESEYVDIKGMFAGAADYYGFDDTQVWENYHGILYNLAADGQQLPKSTSGYYPQIFVLNNAGSLYRGYDSMLIGAFVQEGYIAFMSSELYNDGSLGENGLFLRFYTDEAYSTVAGNVDGFTDMLLVNVKNDDNGVAPSSAAVSAKIAQMREVMKELKEEPFHIYESTPRERIRSIIDSKAGAVKVYTDAVSVNGKCPVKAANVTSVKYAGEVQPRQPIDRNSRVSEKKVGHIK